MGSPSARLACCVVVVAAFLAASVGAQEIRRIEWGFDGTALPERFNLLSVLVENPGSAPLDAELVLTRRRGIGGQLGAELIRRCYVAPGSRRWVQFWPYVTGRRQPWALSWRGAELAGASVPRPGSGPPARVLLVQGDTLTSRRSSVPYFRADRFPSSVVGTGGLGEVLIDGNPAWGPQRRNAFLDWLRSGGVVRVLRRGLDWPEFDDDLALLRRGAAPADRGAGRVIYEDLDRGALLDQLPRALRPVGTDRGDEIPLRVNSVSGEFRTGIEVQHDWLAIGLLGLLYVGAVGPLFWRLSVRRLSWWAGLFVLGAFVGIGSWSFGVIGKWGYDTSARSFTWIHASPLEGGRWDVVGFGSAFVARGDDYQFGVAGEDGAIGAFSTAQLFESVAGEIRNGLNPSFTVDMPPYSWRDFVQRSVVTTPPVLARAPGWIGNASPEQWSVNVVDELRVLGDVEPSGQLLFENRVWECDVRRQGDVIRLFVRRARGSLDGLVEAARLELSQGQETGLGLAVDRAGWLHTDLGPRVRVPTGRAFVLLWTKDVDAFATTSSIADLRGRAVVRLHVQRGGS